MTDPQSGGLTGIVIHALRSFAEHASQHLADQRPHPRRDGVKVSANDGPASAVLITLRKAREVLLVHVRDVRTM